MAYISSICEECGQQLTYANHMGNNETICPNCGTIWNTDDVLGIPLVEIDHPWTKKQQTLKI